jgi:hypothetical protein
MHPLDAQYIEFLVKKSNEWIEFDTSISRKYLEMIKEHVTFISSQHIKNESHNADLLRSCETQ